MFYRKQTYAQKSGSLSYGSSFIGNHNHSVSNLHSQRGPRDFEIGSVLMGVNKPQSCLKSRVTIKSGYINQVNRSRGVNNKFKPKIQTYMRPEPRGVAAKGHNSKYLSKEQVRKPLSKKKGKLTRCQSFVQKPSLKNTKVNEYKFITDLDRKLN